LEICDSTRGRREDFASGAFSRERRAGLSGLWQAEKQAQQDRAWGMWLDCFSIREIAAKLSGPDEDTVGRWLSAIAASADFADLPASRQHFDIWQFASSDKVSDRAGHATTTIS
jgi:hypothetical protein